MPDRTLSDKQRLARRERARRRREEARRTREQEETPKKPSKAAKQRRAAAKESVEQVRQNQKRMKRLRVGVVWKKEMATAAGGVEYGPMWIDGQRIGKKGGRWIAKDMARDIARVLDKKFKEV